MALSLVPKFVENQSYAEEAYKKQDSVKVAENIVNLIRNRERERLQFPQGSPTPTVKEEKPVESVSEPQRATVRTVAGLTEKTEMGYKMFIYNKESNNNPKAKNSNGCLGIGQACPGSKLLRVCPNLDYECEDAFFTKYMTNRYGSWERAYQFWLANHWW